MSPRKIKGKSHRDPDEVSDDEYSAEQQPEPQPQPPSEEQHPNTPSPTYEAQVRLPRQEDSGNLTIQHATIMINHVVRDPISTSDMQGMSREQQIAHLKHVYENHLAEQAEMQMDPAYACLIPRLWDPPTQPRPPTTRAPPTPTSASSSQAQPVITSADSQHPNSEDSESSEHDD